MSRFALRAVVTLAVVALSVPVMAQPKTVRTAAGSVAVETVVEGLDHPWAMTFLPDGRMLITERAGTLRMVSEDGKLSEPLPGTPKVFAHGQGGMLDVELDPDFASNRLVYLSYAEPGKGGASTAVGRGRLTDDRIEGFEVIFRQQPKVDGPNHFGGRIVFAPDGKLFLTMGDRYTFDPAQDLDDHIGTIVRINPDGSVPKDNPFVGRKGAQDEIWSYGHRNIESAVIEPRTGQLWVAEMGPQGGDELNRPQPGRNYGWPEVSWGEHYDGRDIPDPPTRPEFADAVMQWTPVIAPSGMVFYTGDAFPAWRGSMLIGGLVTRGIVRVEPDGEKAGEEERISLGARIREVAQGPDGFVYALTDEGDGKLLRLRPQR